MIIIISYFSNVFSLLVEDILDKLECEAEDDPSSEEEDYDNDTGKGLGDEKEEKREKEKGGRDHAFIEEMGLDEEEGETELQEGETELEEQVTELEDVETEIEEGEEDFDDSFRDPDYQVAKNQVLSSSDDDLDLELKEGFMSGEKRKAGPSGSQAGTRLEAGLGLGRAGGVVDAAEARGPGGNSPRADPLGAGALGAPRPGASATAVTHPPPGLVRAGGG